MMLHSYFSALEWVYTEETFVVCSAHISIKHVSARVARAHALNSKLKLLIEFESKKYMIEKATHIHKRDAKLIFN